MKDDVQQFSNVDQMISSCLNVVQSEFYGYKNISPELHSKYFYEIELSFLVLAKDYLHQKYVKKGIDLDDDMFLQ